MRPGRKQRAQLLDRFRRQLSELAMAGQQRIARHDTRSPGIGDDGQPLTVGRADHAQQLGTIEQILMSTSRTMPARSKAASYTLSTPAIAPVCDAAAWADSGNRPALYATIGFEREQARAADMNWRPFRSIPTYSTTASVAGSWAR